MQRMGYRIIPVRPGLDAGLGEKAYPDLSSVPDAIDIVDVFRAGDKTDPVFEECLKLGYYISFSGIITFKNADSLRAVARDLVPLNRLLVETDSPFLTPVPHRGKKNQPAYTRLVAEKIAELKQLSLEMVAAQTRANTERLFVPG